MTRSLLDAVWPGSNVLAPSMRTLAASPESWVPGTEPTATNRNDAPAASAPVEVTGAKLSGTPFPSASTYSTSPVRSKSSPARFTAASVNVSLPLPVLVMTCGNTAWPPGAATRTPSAVSVRLATCCTMVVTGLDETVYVFAAASWYVAVAWLPIVVPAGGAAWAGAGSAIPAGGAAAMPIGRDASPRVADLRRRREPASSVGFMGSLRGWDRCVAVRARGGQGAPP